VTKANWDRQDFRQIAYKPLAFGPKDVDLIRRGLRGVPWA
jgi:hypothetical protein